MALMTAEQYLESIKKTDKRVYFMGDKIDITEHPELARELGIRATPTLILIENGSIARVLLGVKSARYMNQLIAVTAR